MRTEIHDKFNVKRSGIICTSTLCTDTLLTSFVPRSSENVVMCCPLLYKWPIRVPKILHNCSGAKCLLQWSKNTAIQQQQLLPRWSTAPNMLDGMFNNCEIQSLSVKIRTITCLPPVANMVYCFF